MSIIIPVLNEAENLPRLLQILLKEDPDQTEILVVDGGSSDQTLEVLSGFPVQILQTSASRAHQQNAGAQKATGELLFFVHADTLPPKNFNQLIRQAVAEGARIGGFRSRFDSPSWLLKINARCTCLPFLWARGGDQGIFLTRSFFEQLGGFNEKYVIMEEYDLLRRAGKPYRLLKAHTLISTRKYKGRSWLKVQLANLKAYRMFKRHIDPVIIQTEYRRMLARHRG